MSGKKNKNSSEDNSGSGIKLIAKLASVSIGTVDRVLHNRPGVAEKTKALILKISGELNYKPNIIARRLVSKKKYVFAVLIPAATPDHPYWYQHLEGVDKAKAEVKELGVYIEKFSFDQSERKSFLNQVKKIMAGKYDGIMLPPFFLEETNQLVRHCNSKKIPYVFYDTNLKEKENKALTYIGQDAFKSGYLAGKLVSYFLQPGDSVLCVSINALKNPDQHFNYIQREEGFKKQVEDEAGFKLYSFEYNNPGKGDEKPLENKLLQELTYHPDIKVIFVPNPRTYKVAAILEKNRIKGLKVVGYDLIDQNIDYLRKGMIDFLISQEPFQQGYLGLMSLFNHLILNQKIEKEKLMPITLVMKENLDCIMS